MNNIVNLLTEEVANQIEEIGKMELGSDEYTKTINGATKLAEELADLKKAEAEIKKVEYEHQEKLRAQDIELEQLEEAKKDRKSRNLATWGGIVLPLAGAGWISWLSWKKEDVGTMTYTAGKQATNFLLRFMKK